MSDKKETSASVSSSNRTVTATTEAEKFKKLVTYISLFGVNGFVHSEIKLIEKFDPKLAILVKGAAIAYDAVTDYCKDKLDKKKG